MARLFTVITILMTAFCGIASAISYRPVPCDSTSFYYCAVHGDEAVYDAPWLTEPLGLAAEGEDVDSGSVEGKNSVSKPSVSSPEVPALFKLPADYLSSSNPEYKKVKRDNVEYLSNIKRDGSSVVYMNRDLAKLGHYDSVTMFLPLSTRNLDDYTVKSFGIRAKYIDLKVPLKPHFHIDLNKNPIREQYPWEALFPLLFGVFLVLMAKFFMPGYIGELFLIVFYHNSFMSNVRERNVNADRAGALLMLNYFINAALLAMVALYRYEYVFGAQFMVSFLSLLMLLVAVYFVKRVVSYALSSLFGCVEVYELHYKNLSYIMHCLGVVLLCANVGNLYINIQWAHDSMFWMTVFGAAVAEFLKIFRLFKIIFDKHFPVFYLFLYLCAVEFLPVLVVVKILSR